MTLKEYFKQQGYTEEQIKSMTSDDKFEVFLYEYCGLQGKSWAEYIKWAIRVIYGVSFGNGIADLIKQTRGKKFEFPFMR